MSPGLDPGIQGDLEEDHGSAVVYINGKQKQAKGPSVRLQVEHDERP